MAKGSAKARLRQFFLDHMGQTVTSRQLQEAAGVSEWARRVRELRGQEGWPIITHNDSADLRPGEYKLAGPPPDQPDPSFARNISTKLRAEVLDRNGFTCQMCGATPGEVDQQTGRKVRLHIGHIKDKSLGGKDELSNLRELCSTCNEGAKNVTQEKPTGLWLLAQVRRAGQEEQLRVLEWLQSKYAGEGDSSI